MKTNRWLLYGAYGHTGRLIAEEAVHRGHSPILSGRSEEKLKPIAARLGLEHVVLELNEDVKLEATLDEVDLLLHAAGPFIHTASPMLRACLKTGTSYLDISGETQVVEQFYSMEEEARAAGIAVIPGVGFNVIASDCLARYVADQVAHPDELEIVTHWINENTSPGSIKTMIETFPLGTLARREGQLTRINPRRGLRKQRFINGVRMVLPATLADLATAYRTTRAPNITTYTSIPEQIAGLYSRFEPVLRRLYGISLLRRLAGKWIDLTSKPDGRDAPQEKSQVWALARSENGTEIQAWLETVDSYQFTAEGAVRGVEKVSTDKPIGVLTPAMAFGADFVLEIPGSKRLDRLEDA